MMRFLLTASLVVATCGPPGLARAAVFALANGGSLEGRLLNPDEKPRETYVVQTPLGVQITLQRTQVVRVEEKSEALEWYATEVAKVPDTTAGHWAMAEQCKDRGLKAQRDQHLHRVLELEPNHKDARYALGYSRVDDRWVKSDEFMTAQGYVRYRGTWRIAQDVALEQRADREDRQVRDWRQKVKTWRTWYAKGRGNDQAAVDNLRAVTDPLAAPALAELLADENAPYELRKLCIQILGRLQAPAGVTAFIQASLADTDPNLRDACLDQLSKFGTQAAVREFLRQLHSANNDKVNQAAYCLGVLRQPESTLPLIGALETEHKYLVQQGGNPGQMTLSFGSGPGGGGNSFGVGGRPKIVTKVLKNEQVLHALVTLHPNVNFGYDIDRWRRWYIDNHTSQPLTLRRDD
jgi:hypothetical protein